MQMVSSSCSGVLLLAGLDEGMYRLREALPDGLGRRLELPFLPSTSADVY